MLIDFSRKTLNFTSTLALSTALLGFMLTNSSYAMDPPLPDTETPAKKSRGASLPVISHVEKFPTCTVPPFIRPLNDPADGYPKIYSWWNFTRIIDDLPDINKALSQNAVTNLKMGKTLRGQRDFKCFHYFEAVINDSKALPMLRDQAILDRAQTLLDAVGPLTKVKTEAEVRRSVWADNLRCLHFLFAKKDTSPSQKGPICVALADYYNPLRNSLSPVPRNVEYFMLQALEHTLTPLVKANVLNDVAVLYGDGRLGLKTTRVNKACEYYDKIIQDDSLPIEPRFHGRVHKTRVLLDDCGFQNLAEVESQLSSLQIMLNDERIKDFPGLGKDATFYKARLMFEASRHNQEDSLPKLSEAFTEFNGLMKRLNYFDEQQLQVLKGNYAQILFDVQFQYKLRVSDNKVDLLNKNLEELIHQDTPLNQRVWQEAVLLTAEIISQGGDQTLSPALKEPSNVLLNNPSLSQFMVYSYLSFPNLRKKKIGDLLNSILTDHSVVPTIKARAQALKVVLVAQGLLPKTSKNKDLEDLNKALRDPHLDRSMKLGVLKVLSQKTQELFPNYNKNIGLLTNYLKNILQEEKNPLYQKVIQFILYTYFQAYKECPITSEQAGLYALNLSSDDTPEAFRIKITTDEDLEEEIEATSPQETQENTEHKGFPVVREEEHTGNLSPEDTLGALSVPISPNENLQEILPESLPVTPENTEAKVSIKEIPQIPVESFQPKLIPQIPKFSSNQPTDNGINLMKENLTRQTGIVVAPPPAVVPNPLPVINSKRARNLDRAQLLLEKLEKKRGKIEQKEVTNMLRRLDYTFQPTADHGLTLHLGHKGRKNKKGTPGVLKKGQISDLILVLRDVINKAEPQ